MPSLQPEEKGRDISAGTHRHGQRGERADAGGRTGNGCGRGAHACGKTRESGQRADAGEGLPAWQGKNRAGDALWLTGGKGICAAGGC